MNDIDDDARRSAWSSYWATGQLHSCTSSFAGNYAGAIAAFWQDVFASLAPGARVLDLATGNGALPQMLLQQHADDAGLRIDAIDLAGLAPAWYEPAQHGRLHFSSGIAMEALPFADAGFNLVTSQYGFEYARRDEALAESLRVLAPRGSLALVMHHAGSVLAQVARAEVANVAQLLADDGLLAAAATVLPWFALARAGGDPRAHAAAGRDRAGYNAAQARLAEAIAASAAPDLLVDARDRVHRQIAGTGADPAPTLRALHDWREALQAAQLRSRELVECALTAADVAAMQDQLLAARPQARVSCVPLAQREGVLGWALRLQPPA